VFFPNIDEGFKPLYDEEKEMIKEKYAEGHEYFIYNGIISPHQNLKNLLKAFSAFKKRQKSSMQLLLAGAPGIDYEEWLSALKLYRFQAEVKVLHNLSENEVRKIVAAAYAMVYIPFFETSYETPLQAMSCEVPLIVADTSALPEICGDSALYADPHDFKIVAEKMMALFKDERLRKDLIEKGASRLKNITATRLPIPPFHGFTFFES
jgi:glycosyltransferase involved in cell wall biosynthesis